MADLTSIVASLFEKFDTDKSGTLSPEDIKDFFTELAAARADLSLTEEGYEAWFAAIDKDGDNTVSPAEVEAYLASVNYTA